GLGTVAYAGTTDNKYTGTTRVREGTLLLSQTSGRAIMGPLVVGDGVAPVAVARATQNNQIFDSSAGSVDLDGTYDLNGKIDVIGPLSVNGGLATTGPLGSLTPGNIALTGGTIAIGTGGEVRMTGNITVNPAQTSSFITGPGDLNLNGA